MENEPIQNLPLAGVASNGMPRTPGEELTPIVVEYTAEDPSVVGGSDLIAPIDEGHESDEQTPVQPTDPMPKVDLGNNPAVSDSPQGEIQRKDGFVEWFKSHKNKVTRAWIGATALGAASVAITLAETAAKSRWAELWDEMPKWALEGIAASEAGFIVGGIMMLGALGKKGWQRLNVFRLRSRIEEINNQALDYSLEPIKTKSVLESKLFKSGFVINAIGAIGTAAFLVAGVPQLPREAWGLMAMGIADMALTVAIRIAVVRAIKTSSGPQQVSGENESIVQWDPSRALEVARQEDPGSVTTSEVREVRQ